jgi:hypothetical protein
MAIDRLLIMLALALSLYLSVPAWAESEQANTILPTCNSKEAIENVKEALANSAFKNIANVQVLDYDKISEVAFDAKENVRTCVGAFVLNTGNETIAYTFKQAKSDPSKVLVQVQALNGVEALQVRAQADEHNKSDEQKTQDATKEQSAQTQFKAKNDAMAAAWEGCMKKAQQSGDLIAGLEVCDQKFPFEGNHNSPPPGGWDSWKP